MKLSNVKTAALMRIDTLIKKLNDKQVIGKNRSLNQNDSQIQIELNKDCELELQSVSNLNNSFILIFTYSNKH
jgi:hypothetical protein